MHDLGLIIFSLLVPVSFQAQDEVIEAKLDTQIIEPLEQMPPLQLSMLKLVKLYPLWG